MTDTKKIVITTETTGLYPKDGHKLVEIAAIEIDENDIQTGVVFHAYINPERRISKNVTVIHGLDYKFLKNYPPFAAYKGEFLRFIEGKEIIGHHVQFDMNFINNEVGFELPNKVTDTLEMARKAFPGQKYSLCALSERLNIKIKHSPYNGALLDALYAYEIYKRLKNISFSA
ncbi:MAG: DNA polymerase III subunit epsilon [Alphaproteobacteria bacterium]|nr:DNA polymerase III subunit epsilon [Alphaproteobacteria bacterium]